MHRRLPRHFPLLVLAGCLVLGVVASRAQAQTPSQRDAAEEQSEFTWHLINSAIFAVGFGYAIWKYSPSFFNARSAEIQKAIQDATGLKMQADFRYSEMDRKMATLPEEVARLREQAKVEMGREHGRRQDETKQELQHLEESLQAEVAAARAEGSRQIRQRAALAALASAERQLQQRVASPTDASLNEGLLGDFIHLVERGKN